MMMDDDGETVPRYTNEATVRIELATIPTDEFIRGKLQQITGNTCAVVHAEGKKSKNEKETHGRWKKTDIPISFLEINTD